MKLLMLSLRSDHGGGPKHLLDLATELKRDHPDLVIGIAAPKEEPYGLQFKSLAGDFFFELPHRRFSLIAFIQLHRWARYHGFTTIHSHGRGAGLYSRLLKAMSPRRRIVHTFHGFHRSAGIIGAVKVALDQGLAFLADAYIAVAPDEKILLKKNRCLGNIPCEVVLNGIAVSEQAPQRRAFEGSMGLLARLDRQKGLDLLLHHLEAWQKAEPDRSWVFHLAGFEPELFVVPKTLQKRLIICGPTSDPRTFLRSLDVYVSTSRWEGLPLAVLEAMAEGTPVLLSDVAGHSYFKEKGVANTFALEDSSEFCKQLSQLFDSESERQRLSNQGFRLVSSHHSLSIMARATWPLYNFNA